MPETIQDAPRGVPGHPELQAFLSNLPATAGLRLRTLAHAWQGGGGRLHVGRLAVRLLAADGKGFTFTAGTLHATHGDRDVPTLELSRVLLQAHGVSPAAWTEWCDERVELRDHGFDRQAKFPLVRLDALPDAALARLASGLRDLARSVIRPA